MEDNALSEREINILRWAALLLHIGCAKPSKTSKIHIYSFLSALFIVQMLESGDIARELIEGSGYSEMPAAKSAGEKVNSNLLNRTNSNQTTDSQTVASPTLIANKQRDLRLKAVSELL